MRREGVAGATIARSMNSNAMVTSIPIVDGVLDRYATALGHDFIAYRNHVHRVVNLCLAVTGGSSDNLDKIAVAAAFHDLGIWTDHTFDYIAPSVFARARAPCGLLASGL